MNIEKFIKEDLEIKVRVNDDGGLELNLEDTCLGLGFVNNRDKTVRWDRVRKYLGIQNELKGKSSCPEYITQQQLQKLIQTTNRVLDDKWYELAGLKKNEIILTKEQETIRFICDCLRGITQINLQYKVGNYKIDLYLPEYNLAIECDEFGHQDRDEEYEIEREEYIEGELGCKFIRFNPDDKMFKVSDIINQIFCEVRIKEAFYNGNN